MEQSLRSNFAKYLKGIRKYMTDLKVRLNMDEIVKILEAPLFRIDDLNAIFLKDQNIKIPITQVKTPLKSEEKNFTPQKPLIMKNFHQKQTTQIELSYKHSHSKTNLTSHRDRFKTEQSLDQSISFDFKKIKECLSFGMLQFNRNTKTLSSINNLTKDIGQSLNGSQNMILVNDKIISRSKIKQNFLEMEKEIYRRLCERDIAQNPVSSKSNNIMPEKIHLNFYGSEQTDRKVIIETKPFLVFN
ncbi:hypothetical protein pb186bvf_013297 [Paramecium bursaria]